LPDAKQDLSFTKIFEDSRKSTNAILHTLFSECKSTNGKNTEQESST